MIQPLFNANVAWRLNNLCRESGLDDMRKISWTSNHCYRWIMGQYKGRPGGQFWCNVHPESSHRTATETP